MHVSGPCRDPLATIHRAGVPIPQADDDDRREPPLCITPSLYPSEKTLIYAAPQ